MKRSLKEIAEFKLKTTDGTTGHIKDFLFDDKTWIIRYIEADFGSLFTSQKVLVPRAFFDTPNWDDKHFPLELSKSEIEKCPKIEEHLPVSRKYEENLHLHYNIRPYWASGFADPLGAAYPPPVIGRPANDLSETDTHSILRSFWEVDGYHVEAIDDKLGHIDDLLINDESWHISHVIIDTSNWLPWSKKVLIPIQFLTGVSFDERKVSINLKTESIKNAPEYDPDKLPDPQYEGLSFDYFSQSLIK